MSTYKVAHDFPTSVGKGQLRDDYKLANYVCWVDSPLKHHTLLRADTVRLASTTRVPCPYHHLPNV